MKILITGTSQGIGKAIAERFLTAGHDVIGIDRQAASIENAAYTHYKCDVRDKENYFELDDEPYSGDKVRHELFKLLRGEI